MMESVDLNSVEYSDTAAVATPLTTTLSSEAMLDRVVAKLFGRTKFSKIKQILEDNGIEDLVELAMYDYSELAELQGRMPNVLVPGSLEVVVLSKTEAKKLSLLKSWYKSQPNASWQSFTKDQLDAFIMGSDHNNIGTPAPNNLSKLNYSPFSLYVHQTLLLLKIHQFQILLRVLTKSIKRSSADYPKLKEDKLFASWDSTIQAIATAQDVAEVLNPSYNPTSEQEKQLFKAKNAFMYSVFVSTLITAKSRKHVRKYQKDMNAQALYASLKLA